MKIRIASRTSPLAIFQTKEVIRSIESLNEGHECEIIKIESDGDLTDKPLFEIGGKGLFVSKLEKSLSKNEADIAVHSLKDVPAELGPPDMHKFPIIAMLPREDFRDVILLKENIKFHDLKDGSKIATSGPRRKAQLLAINPKFEIIPIRGNIETRINKLINEDLDGLIVAKAAMNRLKIEYPNVYIFSEEEMLPAASQGVIGIQIFMGDPRRKELINIFTKINHGDTFQTAYKERQIVSLLEGDCLSPISVLCKKLDNDLNLKVRVSNHSGTEIINEEIIVNTGLNDLIQRLVHGRAKELIREK
tara:strand:+ start:1293 stop:2207 length:915 start_codon:yes stop_codon:yes gene_type:complete